MIKLVLINHTFQKPEFYKRWEKLSEKHNDLDITLLAPTEWSWGSEKGLTYGHVEKLQGKLIDKERFHIHLIDIQHQKYGGWTSIKMIEEIISISPDIVYFIGEHRQEAFLQILRERNKHHLTFIAICFSMRGHQQSLHRDRYSNVKGMIRSLVKYEYYKTRLNYFNKNCDVVFCHYPDAVSEFRREGFKGPVYMQTQVGVDPDVFFPCETARKKIREKYNIGNAYLFGSASRFNPSKGLIEIIRALPNDGNWKYLMMGWGREDEVQAIKDEINRRGFGDKIILTGYIDNWKDMSEHWSALDCAIHAPLTTPEWEETFSLALVQAMITGLPIIGSDSGSVPYQIGPDGIIVEERNIDKMRDEMIKMIHDPDLGKSIGKKMRERALNCFSIYHLNELFYVTIKDILNRKYDETKTDMTLYMI